MSPLVTTMARIRSQNNTVSVVWGMFSVLARPIHNARIVNLQRKLCNFKSWFGRIFHLSARQKHVNEISHVRNNIHLKYSLLIQFEMIQLRKISSFVWRHSNNLAFQDLFERKHQLKQMGKWIKKSLSITFNHNSKFSHVLRMNFYRTKATRVCHCW